MLRHERTAIHAARPLNVDARLPPLDARPAALRAIPVRALVAEHLREFERVLFEANVKTQAIMAPS